MNYDKDVDDLFGQYYDQQRMKATMVTNSLTDMVIGKIVGYETKKVWQTLHVPILRIRRGWIEDCGYDGINISIWYKDTHIPLWKKTVKEPIYKKPKGTIKIKRCSQLVK